MPFNLKEQLVFYGSYHRNPTNVAIHTFCVPLLLFTGVLFGSNTPPLISTTRLSPRIVSLLARYNLPLNLGTLSAFTYSSLYLYLSPNVAGATLAPLVLSFASLSSRLLQKYERSKVNTVAVIVHIVSWIAQFIGHGKYEGRKPALVDNVAQALFLAPLFVWYEILFKLGFYKKLQAEVQEGINAEIAKLKAKGK